MKGEGQETKSQDDLKKRSKSFETKLEKGNNENNFLISWIMNGTRYRFTNSEGDIEGYSESL